jgi:hypothetical protein
MATRWRNEPSAPDFFFEPVNADDFSDHRIVIFDHFGENVQSAVVHQRRAQKIGGGGVLAQQFFDFRAQFGIFAAGFRQKAHAFGGQSDFHCRLENFTDFIPAFRRHIFSGQNRRALSGRVICRQTFGRCRRKHFN